MNYITKLAYSCEESEILLKRSSKTIKTKLKKKKKTESFLVCRYFRCYFIRKKNSWKGCHQKW